MADRHVRSTGFGRNRPSSERNGHKKQKKAQKKEENSIDDLNHCPAIRCFSVVILSGTIQQFLFS